MASISKGKVHWRFWIIALAAVVLGTITAWWLLTPRIHPESYGIQVERFAVDSKLVGESLDQVVVLPPGKRPTDPFSYFFTAGEVPLREC